MDGVFVSFRHKIDSSSVLSSLFTNYPLCCLSITPTTDKEKETEEKKRQRYCRFHFYECICFVSIQPVFASQFTNHGLLWYVLPCCCMLYGDLVQTFFPKLHQASVWSITYYMVLAKNVGRYQKAQTQCSKIRIFYQGKFYIDSLQYYYTRIPRYYTIAPFAILHFLVQDIFSLFVHFSYMFKKRFLFRFHAAFALHQHDHQSYIIIIHLYRHYWYSSSLVLLILP